MRKKRRRGKKMRLMFERQVDPVSFDWRSEGDIEKGAMLEFSLSLINSFLLWTLGDERTKKWFLILWEKKRRWWEKRGIAKSLLKIIPWKRRTPRIETEDIEGCLIDISEGKINTIKDIWKMQVKRKSIFAVNCWRTRCTTMQNIAKKHWIYNSFFFLFFFYPEILSRHHGHRPPRPRDLDPGPEVLHAHGAESPPRRPRAAHGGDAANDERPQHVAQVRTHLQVQSDWIYTIYVVWTLIWISRSFSLCAGRTTLPWWPSATAACSAWSWCWSPSRPPDSSSPSSSGATRIPGSTSNTKADTSRWEWLIKLCKKKLSRNYYFEDFLKTWAFKYQLHFIANMLMYCFVRYFWSISLILLSAI